MKFKEKSEHSRAEVEWTVNIYASKGLIQGTIKNVRLGGAYIQVKEVSDMNKNPNASMEIPEFHYAIFGTGETIRFEVSSRENTAVSYGLLVDLKEMPVDDLGFLASNVLR